MSRFMPCKAAAQSASCVDTATYMGYMHVHILLHVFPKFTTMPLSLNKGFLVCARKSQSTYEQTWALIDGALSLSRFLGRV